MPAITIDYTKDGIKVEVNGMTGPGCLRLTQGILQNHAGYDGGNVKTDLKPEFSMVNEDTENRVDATRFCG